MSERKEAFFRLLVLIVSGIVLWLWAYLACALIIINWLIAVIWNKRNKDIAEFTEYWNTESYKFYRYISGVTNQRPFPFTNVEKISKFTK